MFQSPQNTIIKSRYFRMNKEQPITFKNELQVDSNDEPECFTPDFKGKDQLEDIDPLRKTDKIQTIGKLYEQYLKNCSSSSKTQLNKNSCKNPENDQTELITAFKSQDNLGYLTPPREQQFLGFSQHHESNEHIRAVSTEFLFINSPLQSYSTPIDENDSEFMLPNNVQALKCHIEKAKKQTEKLKDQNLKLRLEKVKQAAKTSKNQTMKLVPLKIEHQKLKKNIEKLIQEKELLEMNRKMKQTSKSHQLNINGMEFTVIKHIPGTNYSQQQIEYQKEDSPKSNKGQTKQSHYPQVYNSSPPSSYSNGSYCSSSGHSMGYQNVAVSQEPIPAQSGTDSANNGSGLNKIISGQNQTINVFTNPSAENYHHSNGSTFTEKEVQMMNQNEQNRVQCQNTKGSFASFAKTSLKSGALRPNFYKTQSSQIMHSLNSSSSFLLNSSVRGNQSSGYLQKMQNSAVTNIGQSQTSGNFVSNSQSIRPGTSISHSPRTQNS